MNSEAKKFLEWLSRRRKAIGLRWKEIYADAALGKTTVTKIARGEQAHANSRDRFAQAFYFADWKDMQKAYHSGLGAEERLPTRVKRDDLPAPARLAETLLRFAEDDAKKYRDQVFQNLTPRAVAEIAEIFTQRLARYAKGG